MHTIDSNMLEDDATCAGSFHSEIPDCWENNTLRPIKKRRVLADTVNGNRRPCCIDPTKLFEESFVCNKSLENQLDKILKLKKITDISFVNINIKDVRFSKKKNKNINILEYNISGYIHNCRCEKHVNAPNVYHWLYHANKNRGTANVSFKSLIEMRNIDYTSIIMGFLTPHERGDNVNLQILAKKLIAESKDVKTISLIKKMRNTVISKSIKCMHLQSGKTRSRIPYVKSYDCYFSSSAGLVYGIDIRPYNCYGCPKSHYDVERGYDYYFHLDHNRSKFLDCYDRNVVFCIKIIENNCEYDFYDEVGWNMEYDSYIGESLETLMMRHPWIA